MTGVWWGEQPTRAADQGSRCGEKKNEKKTNKKDKILFIFSYKKYFEMLICSKYFSQHFFTLRHALVPATL